MNGEQPGVPECARLALRPNRLWSSHQAQQLVPWYAQTRGSSCARRRVKIVRKGMSQKDQIAISRSAATQIEITIHAGAIYTGASGCARRRRLQGRPPGLPSLRYQRHLEHGDTGGEAHPPRRCRDSRQQTARTHSHPVPQPAVLNRRTLPHGIAPAQSAPHDRGAGRQGGDSVVVGLVREQPAGVKRAGVNGIRGPPSGMRAHLRRRVMKRVPPCGSAAQTRIAAGLRGSES
mmetsp:Transcript_7930/g.26050  ORF Transcript_7930/g.26050 Transcript_7930/m.26050 type:complete len:233 (-) Transcript_7930:524-1222(-)